MVKTFDVGADALVRHSCLARCGAVQPESHYNSASVFASSMLRVSAGSAVAIDDGYRIIDVVDWQRHQIINEMT
jgi:hypothetical protein